LFILEVRMSVPFAFSLEAVVDDGHLNFRHFISQELIPQFIRELQEVGLEPRFLGRPGNYGQTFTLKEQNWVVLFEQRKFWVRGSVSHPDYGCIVPNHYPKLKIHAHPVWRKGVIHLTVPCSNAAFVESWKQFLLYRLGIYFIPSDLTEDRWKVLFPAENYPEVLNNLGYTGDLRDVSFMRQFQIALNSLFTEGVVSWSAHY
jgi:hypothetical protein